MAETRYIDALHEALREELQRDPAVFVLGEDVAVGGPFGATAGLVEEFGKARVINTPISEDTIMGIAVGAALVGMRPIVEIMFIDFITLAMNQLMNHAVKIHYMSGGQLSVPLVIRTQGGAVGAWGAHHSQSLEAWLLHAPGLKVVAASNAADAKGLLTAAIRDDNPVVFLEHRGLYFRRDEVPAEEPGPPILERARIMRPGKDVTIVAYLRMVWEAMEAAVILESRGISTEVIDLRSLAPLDMETLAQSVARTHRLVVVHEAVTTGGVGAEIAAQLQADVFDELDAPIQRVGAPFAPVPASPVLEKAFVPGHNGIVAAVERTLGQRS